MSWINAKTHTPDDDLIVLIHCPQWSEPVWFGFICKGQWYTAEGETIDCVAHWQELPEPPEAEEEESICPRCNGCGESGSSRPDDYGRHLVCSSCDGRGVLSEI